ncbi:hypothetical protein LUZ63_012835 [Rhynchospora breviuscula]|uniref:C2 NT-type domain-containing protein n=1 Tax=Rhynchospora breviuscula TaxID=2022672 RepID=A0A9Q0HKC0_9POAL|nr:hypothetical protein LUZ63_012835 [Rhynchospora breviuscula]
MRRNKQTNGHLKVENKNKLQSDKMRVRVQLTIDHLENLNVAEVEEGYLFMVKIGWLGGTTKTKYLSKSMKENHTSIKSVQADGVVRWSEEFDHAVKLKTIKPEGYKSWFLYLGVQEVKNDLGAKSLIAPNVKIDITKDLAIGTKRTVRVPLDSKIRGKSTTAILEVTIQITELQAEPRPKFSFKRATSSLLFSCGRVESCVPSFQNARTVRRRSYSITNQADLSSRVRNPAIDCSSSEGEPEPSYKNLRLCNFLINQFEFKDEDDDAEDISVYGSEPSLSPDLFPIEKQEEQNQYPIKRLLSRVISAKKDEQPKGVPLLNKSCSDIGGDDIDIQRHKESNIRCILGNSRSTKVYPEETFRISGFHDDEPFEIGNWERKSVLSRDRELELMTDVFLATIDQRSEKASGGSACTVLAVVIADWLHRNPGVLPLRCQLDQLVREGSLIWRELCQDENHRERFSDQHFDLETVLKEGIRPLTEVVDLSYVGFLGMDELNEGAEYLQGAMSFDSIWDQILQDGLKMEYQVYICSWNDHFFVVKIERDAIYLIDTFGERLFEGCNQAYIVRFDKNSVILRGKIGSTDMDGEGSVGSSNKLKEGNCSAQENVSHREATCEEPSKEENMKNQQQVNNENIKHDLSSEAACTKKLTTQNEINSEEKASTNEGIERDQEEKEEANCKEVISEGIDSCREYIKGFLASLPVRQLQMEMRLGSIREHTIHRRLQIEFHYVAPCIMD